MSFRVLSFNPFWKFLRLGILAWDFLRVNFWSRDFFGILLEALGIFLGFDFLPLFDHPRHLKLGVPPLGNTLNSTHLHVYME